MSRSYFLVKSEPSDSQLINKKTGLKRIFSPMKLYGDNDSMEIMFRLEKFKLKQFSNLDHTTKPRWTLYKKATFLKSVGVKL